MERRRRTLSSALPYRTFQCQPEPRRQHAGGFAGRGLLHHSGRSREMVCAICTKHTHGTGGKRQSGLRKHRCDDSGERRPAHHLLALQGRRNHSLALRTGRIPHANACPKRQLDGNPPSCHWQDHTEKGRHQARLHAPHQPPSGTHRGSHGGKHHPLCAFLHSH